MPPLRPKPSSLPPSPPPFLDAPVDALVSKSETSGSTTASKTARSRKSKKRSSSSPEAGFLVQSNGKRKSTRAKADLQNIQEEHSGEEPLSNESKARKTTRAPSAGNEVIEEEKLTRMSGYRKTSTKRAGPGRPPLAPTQVSKKQSSIAQMPPSEENMFQKRTPQLRKTGPLALLIDNTITPVTQAMEKDLENPTPALRSSARLRKVTISYEDSVNEKKTSSAIAKRNSSSDLQSDTSKKRARKNVVENSTTDISLGAARRSSTSCNAPEISNVSHITNVLEKKNTQISDPADTVIQSTRRRGRNCNPVKSIQPADIHMNEDSEDQIYKQPTGSINQEDLHELNGEKFEQIAHTRSRKPARDSARRIAETRKSKVTSESVCLNSKDAVINQCKDGSKLSLTPNTMLDASPKNRRKNVARKASSRTRTLPDGAESESERATGVMMSFDQMKSSAMNSSGCDAMESTLTDGDELRVQQLVNATECEEKPDILPSKRKTRNIGRKTVAQRKTLPPVIENREGQHQESECIDENIVVHTQEVEKLESKSQTRAKKSITRKRNLPKDVHESKRLKSGEKSCKRTRECAKEVSEKGNENADDVIKLDRMLITKERSKKLLFDALPVGFGLGVSGWRPSPLPGEIMAGRDVLQLVAEEEQSINTGMDQLVVLRYNRPESNDSDKFCTSNSYNRPESNDSDKFCTSIRLMDEHISKRSTNTLMDEHQIVTEASIITKDDQIPTNFINTTSKVSKQETANKSRKGTKAPRDVAKSPGTIVKGNDTKCLSDKESQPLVRRSSRNRK